MNKKLTVNNMTSLKLQVGDQIVWQDAEIKPEGDSALVSPGMRGKVISLHEAAYLDIIPGGHIPARACVEFESGFSLVVSKKHKWKKISKPQAVSNT